MSRNTCGARRRSEATGLKLAGLLATVTAMAVLSAYARVTDAGAYQLAAQLPDRIWKGQAATLILRVQKGGRPADDVAACLAPAPLFASEEDVSDRTPAMGSDLGAAAEPALLPACVMAIAAIRTAPGVYQFTWEPDTAGRVNLRFTVGNSRLDAAVDVGSPPADPAILAAFALMATAILSTAWLMRRRRRQQGGST